MKNKFFKHKAFAFKVIAMNNILYITSIEKYKIKKYSEMIKFRTPGPI